MGSVTLHGYKAGGPRARPGMVGAWALHRQPHPGSLCPRLTLLGSASLGALPADHSGRDCQIPGMALGGHPGQTTTHRAFEVTGMTKDE